MKTKFLADNNFLRTDSQNKLSLYEISPVWAKRLNRAIYEIPRLSLIRLKWYFELKNASRCVVGEAYGFSSAYVSKCKKCNRLGWCFMFYFMVQSNSRIEETKIKFVDHWNKAHSGIGNNKSPVERS
jgi:hypothetical protein